MVRDDDWAIGMMGLDDNTIAGPPVDGDCYGMGYYVHSPDPLKYRLPPQYQEGQWFNIGGDGVSDTAFYSHAEEYFRQVSGTGQAGAHVRLHGRLPCPGPPQVLHVPVLPLARLPAFPATPPGERSGGGR